MSMDLSMNWGLRMPAEPSGYELVHADAQVVSSCGMNSKSHNPSGRGFDSHPPPTLSSTDRRAVVFHQWNRDYCSTDGTVRQEGGVRHGQRRA